MDKCGSQENGIVNPNNNYTFQQLVARFRASNPNRELPPRSRLLAILCEKLLQRELMAIKDLKLVLLGQINSVKKRVFIRDMKNANNYQCIDMSSSYSATLLPARAHESQEGVLHSSLLLHPSNENPNSESISTNQNFHSNTELQEDIKQMSATFKSAMDAKIHLLKQYEKSRNLHQQKTARYQNLICRYIGSLDYIQKIAIQFLSNPCSCSFTPPSRRQRNTNSTRIIRKTITNQMDGLRTDNDTGTEITLRCGDKFHYKLMQLWPFFRGVQILHIYLLALEIWTHIIVWQLTCIFWFFHTLRFKSTTYKWNKLA